MAALLPGASEEFAVKVEQGKLIPYIGTTRLPGTNDRTRHLESVAARQGKPVFRHSVEEFLAEDGRLLTNCIQEKRLPVAFTSDLDEGGEIAARVSFRLFDEILDTCALFVDQALSLGFCEVIVAGDHGFLVRDPHAAPGGVGGVEPAAGGFSRGLRYAAGAASVGRGLLCMAASKLGRVGDDVYVPRDTSCLAIQGGPGLFVHGGLSPQECVLIFLSVLPGTPAVAAQILPVSLKVRTRETSLTFKVQIVAGAVKQPLLVEPRTVVLKVEDERGTLVFDGGAFTLTGGDAEQTRSITVTVACGGAFGVCLYEESTGRLLAKHPVQVEVLGDDFGF